MQSKRKSGGWAMVAIAGIVTSICVATFGSTSSADAKKSPKPLATFSAHGTYTWTVPRKVKQVTIDVFGASGGNVVGTQGGGVILLASGGAGGEAEGTFAVTPGETIEVVVGGQGENGNGSSGGSGGFNGGGFGNSSNVSGVYGGAGGGGGSDVRIGGAANPCTSNTSCVNSDRIIVAGGGGGAAYSVDSNDISDETGGVGGGLNGSQSSESGAGAGTQSSGGFSTQYYFCLMSLSNCYGAFGQGGNADGSIPGGGGGGGGWYGGGSGDDSVSGGGGSGYVSGLALSGSFAGGTHRGDGLVVITK